MFGRAGAHVKKLHGLTMVTVQLDRGDRSKRLALFCRHEALVLQMVRTKKRRPGRDKLCLPDSDAFVPIVMTYSGLNKLFIAAPPLALLNSYTQVACQPDLDILAAIRTIYGNFDAPFLCSALKWGATDFKANRPHPEYAAQRRIVSNFYPSRGGVT